MSARVCVIVLLLFSISLPFCAEAKAGSEYKIIDTGIEARGGCWVDDTHFVVVKGRQPSGSTEFDVEGLYYFDPRKPKDLKRIDLSPIEPAMQRAIRDVSCQEQTVLFDWLDRKHKVMRVYGLKLGQAPELFGELRGATTTSISLKGRYILGNKLTVEKGVWEEQADCNVRQIKPGFRVLCWPKKFEHRWPLPDAVLTEYRWEDTIKIRGRDGQIKITKNPVAPLLDQAGQPVIFTVFLRNLEGEVLRQVPFKIGSYHVTTTFLTADPSEKFVYAPCFSNEDHDLQYSNFGRVCRMALGGVSAAWEEVFTVQNQTNEDVNIQDLNVNSRGDVAFVFLGKRYKRGIWQYRVSGGTMVLDQVTSSPYDTDSWPKVSPTGQFVVFLRKGKVSTHLFIAEAKGE